MLSPSGSVPATDAPRPLSGEPLDHPKEHHQQFNSRQLPPRPRSLADSPLDSTTSLQRHFHHQRHQSGSDLRPSTSTLSPTLPTPDGPRAFDMPLTGDNRGGQSPGSRGILSSWLPSSPAETGRSARARSTTPLSPGATPTKAAPGQRSQQQTTPTPKNSTSSPGTSRFAFISSSISALTKSAQAQTPAPGGPRDDDELAQLNIEEALFPRSPSSPGPRDPFSPASYKNLEQSASALLSTFQNAYRRQREEIRELQMDRDARNEELEETSMRTRHLKMQLEDLARQATAREQEMQALVAALERERKMNREGGGLAPPQAQSDSATVVSEDLGAEEDQKLQGRGWRKSEATFEDTDEESESVGEAPSVFSRSRSPTFAPAGTTAAAKTGGGGQMNAFQKLVKGITGEGDGASTATCRNCQGREAQTAWDTVGLLRDENRALKERVTDLERCVEGALDAVNGLRL